MFEQCGIRKSWSVGYVNNHDHFVFVLEDGHICFQVPEIGVDLKYWTSPHDVGASDVLRIRKSNLIPDIRRRKKYNYTLSKIN